MLSPRGENAFALLLVVTLLAFLVILLVGLATYTRVETAVAGNTQRQAQARENALLALNVAVAHLQKYGGPDQRVTATADSFPNTTSTRHYTGVWPTDPAADPDGDLRTPLTWLTSGNELVDDAGAPAPLAVTPETVLSTAASVALIGVNTSGTANDVRAPLVPLTVAGVPGTSSTASSTIGRYAWWIGDQGVKAPVALSDPTTTAANYDYAPLISAEARRRVRQQISLGAGSADVGDQVSFEPRDTTGSPSNATLANNTLAPAQIAFFRAASGTVNLAAVQRNYFSWSTNNSSVLANTNPASPGLRRDLSLKPDLLGAGFVAWANYNPKLGGYMEDPLAPLDPPRLRTDTVADPVLQRYRLTPRTEADGIEHRVAPILSFFGLSFSLRNDTAGTALELSARCVVGLWNPYSAGLVPEDLELKVTGLPTVMVTSHGAPPRFVDLQRRMENADGDVKFALPFTPNGTDPDRSTWLPGRVYNWSAKSSVGDPGSAGYETVFYARDASQSGSGIVRDGGAQSLGPDSIAGALNYRVCSVPIPQVFRIELRRASTGEKLAEFRSPQFDAFATDDLKRPVGALQSDFAYVFRLPDGAELPTGETATWLRALGRDPREFAFPNGPQESYVVAGGQMPNPALLVTLNLPGFPASYSQVLLDRYTAGTGRNFTEDVPVFELPRFSLLSLGTLQHLLLPGERPFAVGNSWGGARNAWFDQYFFSGLTPDVLWIDPAKPLPNPRLRVLRRKPDASDTTVDDVRGVDRVADGYSSKYLLQDGAFNVNSVSKTAWAAVLRGVRFTSSTNFTLANVSTSTGTTAVSNGDATTTLSDPWLTNSRVAAFPRFPQSAQETFQVTVDPEYVQSDPDPAVRNYANTPLFRRGLRFLSTTEIGELADKIVSLVQQKHTDSGPFRTMQEFISPSALFVDAGGGQVSVLEKAIEDAQLNTDAALGLTTTTMEFSSQWLTQGDILTALAPVLFPRSDTFVVRTYGEAVNPATNATEGRAWCEALVQRVPEYFDPSVATGDAAEVAPSALVNTFNQTYGRRFKIISFRWLTRSDI